MTLLGAVSQILIAIDDVITNRSEEQTSNSASRTKVSFFIWSGYSHYIWIKAAIIPNYQQKLHWLKVNGTSLLQCCY